MLNIRLTIHHHDSLGQIGHLTLQVSRVQKGAGIRLAILALQGAGKLTAIPDRQLLLPAQSILQDRCKMFCESDFC